jgi:hypothetical protein
MAGLHVMANCVYATPGSHIAVRVLVPVLFCKLFVIKRSPLHPMFPVRILQAKPLFETSATDNVSTLLDTRSQQRLARDRTKQT